MTKKSASGGCKIHSSPLGQIFTSPWFRLRRNRPPSTGDLARVIFIETPACRGDVIKNYCATVQEPIPANNIVYSPCNAFATFSLPPETTILSNTRKTSTVENSLSLICNAVMFGDLARSKAAAPDTCGVAMEMPERLE